MAVAVGAGCDFLTPIGHQCNTLVMGPGGYRFGDYCAARPAAVGAGGGARGAADPRGVAAPCRNWRPGCEAARGVTVASRLAVAAS